MEIKDITLQNVDNQAYIGLAGDTMWLILPQYKDNKMYHEFTLRSGEPFTVWGMPFNDFPKRISRLATPQDFANIPYESKLHEMLREKGLVAKVEEREAQKPETD